MNQKNLRVHAVPVVMMAIAVFMVGTTLALASGTLGTYIPASVSGRALTTEVFKVKPNRDGLASIEFNIAKPAAPKVQNEPLLASSEQMANGTLTELKANQLRDSFTSIR